ncbi:MAG TPA: nitroreductase/quinone reductase family protein, partial [Candidatus Limnocylindrales bacterium]|nr:nitroreductase/quinone reductase family protein [Candidatus Limnocylindrales bacterium]
AAIIRVRGRTSGRLIDTPVGAVPHEDGFLVSLPYGTRPQWLRNLLAAGEGTLVHEGSTWAISRPEVQPLEPVAGVFSPSDQRMHALFGVADVLRVRADPTGERALTPAA